MADETGEQQMSRLRQLRLVAERRGLTADELWEMSRLCRAVGETEHAQLAAKHALAIDATQIGHNGPPFNRFAKYTWCAIIMVPVVLLALLVAGVFIVAHLCAWSP